MVHITPSIHYVDPEYNQNRLENKMYLVEPSLWQPILYDHQDSEEQKMNFLVRNVARIPNIPVYLNVPIIIKVSNIQIGNYTLKYITVKFSLSHLIFN